MKQLEKLQKRFKFNEREDLSFEHIGTRVNQDLKAGTVTFDLTEHIQQSLFEIEINENGHPRNVEMDARSVLGMAQFVAGGSETGCGVGNRNPCWAVGKSNVEDGGKDQ